MNSGGMPRNTTPPPLEARTITAAREYAGLSREQLGQRIGRSAEQIGRYERGQNHPIGVALMEAIARATGAPYEWLKHGWPDQEAGPAAATRFADATRLEAQRQRERRSSDSVDPDGEDEAGEGQ